MLLLLVCLALCAEKENASDKDVSTIATATRQKKRSAECPSNRCTPMLVVRNKTNEAVGKDLWPTSSMQIDELAEDVVSCDEEEGRQKTAVLSHVKWK